jgi:molecular chaperone GrpE
MSTKQPTKAQLKERIGELEKDLAKKEDQLLRAYADFQNYQKRIEKEFKEETRKEKGRLLLKFIDIQEGLEKALAQFKSGANQEGILEGLELELKAFNKLLESEGIKPIETKGKQFDYRFHEAISQVESKDVKEGIVIEEIKKGYKLGEKVLRLALVAVTKEPKSG